MGNIVDNFGRRFSYLRLSITGRCNFACQYCSIPKDRADLLSGEELIRIARVVASIGVTKIRLTGGEPTVRRDLLDVVRGIAAVPGIQRLVLTTNGAKLSELARPLREAGLQGVNISLDSFHADCFEKISKGGHLDEVLAGIDAAIAQGLKPIKINMVVMGGINEQEVPRFAQFAAERGIEVRFIEYMPMEAGESRGWTLPYQVLLERLRERWELSPMEPDMDAGPAERYAIGGTRGVVGFIHAMSNPFCARCNRLRVTSEGRIRSCLLTAGELDLVGPMRAGASDEEIVALFRRAAIEKPEVYELHRDGNVAMRSVGG